MNNMIVIRHNQIRSSFEHSVHIVSHTFNVQMYKRLCGFVSRYPLSHIAHKVDRMKSVGVDMSRCGCIVS